MKHKFLLLYTWFIRILLFPFPDVPIIMRFRGWLYGLGMSSCGKDFQVSHDVNIKGLESICVGNNCFIGNNSILMGSGNIILQDEVMIGPNNILISGNHGLHNGSFRFGKGITGTIKICSGAWIASNCTISASSVLPPSSVLGANSFLNREYTEGFCIYAGSPAIMIKKI